MNFALSIHALTVITEREIDLAWIERVLDEPLHQEIDEEDPMISHFYGRVPEQGNRLLRVVLNIEREPPLVITTYFDRTKGKKI